ncbi:MAG: rod shape-determining protein [Pseudomonadota bacterium]
MFKRIIGYFSNDLAIDLGTANTLVYAKGRGIIINEPSVVAIRTFDNSTRKVIAVGTEAKEMIGKTPPNISAIRPMKDGVIADFEITQVMLKHFIRKAHNRGSFIRPRIVICIPFGITEVERRAVRESAETAGSRETFLIEEPMAAAIGSNLPIAEPGGNMVVDIGGGTTEVAVISLAGIVHSRSIRVGGDKMDEAIINYIKRKYNMLIGDKTAEKVKMEIGSALEDENRKELAIKGNDLVSGIPKQFIVNSKEINDALYEPIHQIVETIRLALEKTPPELSGDIVERGVVLTGGACLLRNFDALIREEIKIPVFRAEEPLLSVVKGCGEVLSNINLLKKVTT